MAAKYAPRHKAPRRGIMSNQKPHRVQAGLERSLSLRLCCCASAAIDADSEAAEALAKSDDISAETKEALTRASEGAAEAMNELTAAQENAAAAMEGYDSVIVSGTSDLDALEGAAQRAGRAVEELEKATEQAADGTEKGSKKGVEAVNGIASALAAAGITAAINEIAEAAYGLADAFSEAESTVVKATGASGEALDSLMESTMNAYAAAKSADLSSTASAIGEINTRMGLTGDELTIVTGQFLDFAEITGTNVVSSVQSATKIMNKWGIEAGDVESVLDKLPYLKSTRRKPGHLPLSANMRIWQRR